MEREKVRNERKHIEMEDGRLKRVIKEAVRDAIMETVAKSQNSIFQGSLQALRRESPRASAVGVGQIQQVKLLAFPLKIIKTIQ